MNIKIYQINTSRDIHRIAFLASDEFHHFTGSSEIDSSIYDCAYEGVVDCHTLEDIYQKFNIDHPIGYRGRSLSISDIVEIIDSDSVEKGFYFCDTVGFKKVDFESEKAKPIQPKKIITVVLVEPNNVARVADIGGELEELQSVVDGNIEAFYPYEEEVAIVCNDEGKIAGKELNRAIYDKDGEMIDIVAGTFFICDCSGESFGSLSKEQQERYVKQFFYPEAFVRTNGEIKVLKYKPEKDVEAR